MQKSKKKMHILLFPTAPQRILASFSYFLFGLTARNFIALIQYTATALIKSCVSKHRRYSTCLHKKTLI